MDEELWLDYYYGRNEKERDEEPDPDSREESGEIKCQEKDELENNIQNEKQDPNPRIEPSKDLEDKKSDQKIQHHQERRRWSRDHRSRITGRTYQRSQQTIIDKAPSLQREIQRRLSPTDQIIQMAVSAIRQLENPDQRKKSIYFGKVYELKDQNKLAPSTAAKYEREAKTLRSLKEQYSNEEMFLHIVHLATNKSRSTYFRQKAILERILSDQEAAGDRSGIGLLRMLRHMPDYHRIRHIFGQEVEKSKETDKRRNCKIGWEAVKAYTSVIHSPAHPNMQLVPLILYFTGARISELRDLRIYAEPNGELAVKIKSKKTGCASRAPKERTVRLRDKDFCEWLISDGIGTTNTEPFKDIPSNTARNALLSARRKLARKSIDVPSPHYFRHNYATMRRAAGVDNEQLRREMGHTNQETTRQYGGGNIRHSH